MPELPEIAVLATQMTAELAGKTVAAVHVRQPKCLNVTPEELAASLVGRTLGETRQHGKWLVTPLKGGADIDGEPRLAINLGMGGDLLYHPASAPGQATVSAETASPQPGHQQPEQPAQYQYQVRIGVIWRSRTTEHSTNQPALMLTSTRSCASSRW
jgi:formamidopyrimidine-DNA glycosylase